MTTNAVSRSILFALVLSLSFVLSACERPLQDEQEIAPPTLDMISPSEEVYPGPARSAPADVAYPSDSDDAGDNSTINNAPEVSVEPTVDPLAVEAAPEPSTYIIAAGDTLFTIAQRFNVSIDDLAAANNLDINALLDPGSSLTIPVDGAAIVQSESEVETDDITANDSGERIHVVQPGENLYRIGLIYGFTIEELATYNALDNPDYIDVGDEIRIPPSGEP